jgi:hypothetical protein
MPGRRGLRFTPPYAFVGGRLFAVFASGLALCRSTRGSACDANRGHPLTRIEDTIDKTWHVVVDVERRPVKRRAVVVDLNVRNAPRITVLEPCRRLRGIVRLLVTRRFMNRREAALAKPAIGKLRIRSAGCSRV